MKYKVGDKVRVRSREWYENNKSYYGDIECGSRMFYREMLYCCDRIVTIKNVHDGYYRIVEDGTAFIWTDEMFEGLVEEETKPNIIEEAKTYWDSIKDAWICPEGYIFKDENGNVINATKIVLEKKKKECPKTYEECCKVLGIDALGHNVDGYKWEILSTFQNLIICRDAYWKIAGEELGLGKPWKPDWTNINEVKFIIGVSENEIIKCCSGIALYILAFPTEEMRDVFKENFDPDIDTCKELL